MAKKIKSKVSRVPKVIKATEKFEVHELAVMPYQIFCELFNDEISITSLKPVSSKIASFEVVSKNDKYLFFEDFRLVSLLPNEAEISVRSVGISEAEVERRAWSYLMHEFISLDPLNPIIFEAIKSSIPVQVQRVLFNGSLTIQSILDSKNIKRRQYDYRRKLSRNKRVHNMPSFSNLIQEVQDDFRSRAANTDT